MEGVREGTAASRRQSEGRGDGEKMKQDETKINQKRHLQLITRNKIVKVLNTGVMSVLNMNNVTVREKGKQTRPATKLRNAGHEEAQQQIMTDYADFRHSIILHSHTHAEKEKNGPCLVTRPHFPLLKDQQNPFHCRAQFGFSSASRQRIFLIYTFQQLQIFSLVRTQSSGWKSAGGSQFIMVLKQL